MHGYCVQLSFEQQEYYAFAYPLDSMNFKCLFKPMAVIIAVSKTFDHHDGWCNWVEWGHKETTDSKPKDLTLFLRHIKGKGDLISSAYQRCCAKCRQRSLCTCETASERLKVNNFWWHLHILQYANEQSCKSQIARREKRRWRGKKNGEGAAWKREKETDGGWCKLWMQPAISKRERKAERKLQSCISDYAFTTFSYHGPWTKLKCNLASLCMRAYRCMRLRGRTLTY